LEATLSENNEDNLLKQSISKVKRSRIPGSHGYIVRPGCGLFRDTGRHSVVAILVAVCLSEYELVLWATFCLVGDMPANVVRREENVRVSEWVIR